MGRLLDAARTIAGTVWTRGHNMSVGPPSDPLVAHCLGGGATASGVSVTPDLPMPNGKMVVLPTKRGLSERQAAAYVGVGLETFRSEAARGIWPGPRLHGRKQNKTVWDKRALDLAYDRLSSIGPGEAEHEAAALAALDRRYGR